MKKKDHLPRYGVGPFYVIGIVILTVLGLTLAKHPILASGRVAFLDPLWLVLGLVCIGFGIFVWCAAFFWNKIGDNIRSNQLVTTGIYAHVRNPIYSGIAITLTGVLLLSGNLWMLLLPPVFWVSLTILMIHTEEKWLKNLYGAEYEDYCKKVNRCIPWF